MISPYVMVYIRMGTAASNLLTLHALTGSQVVMQRQGSDNHDLGLPKTMECSKLRCRTMHPWKDW